MAVGPRRGFLERYSPGLVLIGAGTVALLVVLARGGVDAGQIGRVYVLSVGAIVVVGLLLELRRVGSDRWSNEPPPTRPVAPLPAQLEMLQDALRAGRANRSQFQRQVVPLLREVAADRLLLLGVSLTREPERAAKVLGPELSSALREEPTPAGGLPAGRMRPGELEPLLEALDAVGR
ncbi:MAG TPA: hypothetical protein VNH20_04665 [Candidatus Dormibacteraeota bacterium]|nr:hypothetical protein [Candidatus Dormibacteraeota bacterium]